MYRVSKKLVLATKSPRRIALLKELGIDFLVIKPRTYESIHRAQPRSIVLDSARRKAYSVLDSVPYNAVVVAADTIIVDDSNRVYGKPSSLSEAARILKILRGKWHRVLTGVYIVDVPDRLEDFFISETKVKLRNFSDKELEVYLSSLESLDKAGAYALQGIGRFLVEEIIGDPYNVVGLPLSKLYEVLLKHGIDLLKMAVMKKVVGAP
ncbi:MAG: septum formation protein Maf [Desulfurococcales archaeon]|nr:septum formation protein Maf [Desulfurococcales archaeon]